MKWRALALGATVGFLVALFPSCGPKQAARCLRSNCSGCCDDKLGCLPGITPAACGTGALTCQACASGQTCVDGACRSGSGGGGGGDGGTTSDAGSCGPNTCSGGCCLSGECKAGNQNSSCGTGGATCVQCPSGQSCQAHACSSATCSGCLDAVANCQLGNSNNACGGDGGMCVACNVGSTCVDGSCVGGGCSPTNCPNGCCAGTTCVDPGDTNAQCGTGGVNCATCQGLEQCTNAVCFYDGGSGGGGGGGGWGGGGGGGGGSFGFCGPGGIDPCTTGCCEDPLGIGIAFCVTPPDDWSCGIGGGTCTDCSAASKTCNTTTGSCQ